VGNGDSLLNKLNTAVLPKSGIVSQVGGGQLEPRVMALSKGKQRFKKTDVARLIRAAQEAGVRDFTARVTPAGAIEIEITTVPTTNVIDASNEWDVAS
jgi:hypothetical protein